MNESKKLDCPTFEEIYEVAKPESPELARTFMSKRIEQYYKDNERLEGVWLFLNDHNFNYDLLYEFLFNDNIKLSHQTKFSKNYKRISAAAAVIIGILFSFLWMKDDQQTQRILKYTFIDIGLPVFASGESDFLFNEMMSRYKENEYSKARELVNKLDNQIVHNDTLDYYAGLIYFNLGEFELASFRLILVANDTNSAFQNKAMYNLAICESILGDKVSSKKKLLELKESDDMQINNLSNAILSDENVWQ
jgi:hypothetical protein